MNDIKSHEHFPIIQEQQAVLERKQPSLFPIAPLNQYHFFDPLANIEKGLGLMKEGAMGCLIVAGGQGTRAKFSQPKGMFSISNVKMKSFFQLFAEKTAAASILAGRPLPLAIMTSPLNNEEIRKFFQENNFFGLQSDQIDFFTQEMLPFLDDEGEVFVCSPGQIAQGPNGNGVALKEFVKSGIFEKWRKNGVRYLNFVMIDNPLADPFDLALLDFHVKQNAELTLKCVERTDTEEKVGLIVQSEEQVRVVEYSEAPESIFKDKSSYPLANISLFMIDMETVKNVSGQKMPLHAAYKPAVIYDEASQSGKTILAWKFEYFIFDILSFIKKVEVLVYPKERCFAPLKSADEVEKVQNALLENDRKKIQEITEKDPPSIVFELDQQFYYPTEELKEKCRHKEAPLVPYITPDSFP